VALLRALRVVVVENLLAVGTVADGIAHGVYSGWVGFGEVLHYTWLELVQIRVVFGGAGKSSKSQ
jgi:hypothetical protein